MDDYKNIEERLPSRSRSVTRATILVGSVINALDLTEMEKLAVLAECTRMFVDYTSLKCLIFDKDEETVSKIMEELLSSVEEDE